MLDYIKEEIAKRYGTPEAASPEQTTIDDVPNEAILEYAHIFQELDDLTEEGTDAGQPRSMGIDIPLEDDLEVETVEVNLNDGRLTDIPGDASAPSVQESYYDNLKPYEDFVQEAMNEVRRFPRESDSAYENRVNKLANEMYTEYCNDMALRTNNAYEKISLDEREVPNQVKINFGKVNEDENAPSFMTKLKVHFATDAQHMITRNQLDSLKTAVNGAFQRIGKPLMAYMESANNVPAGYDVWDICTPKSIIVPKGTVDSFCVVLEYTNELTGKNEYFGWTSAPKADTELDLDAAEKVNMESFVTGTHYENKASFIQEMATEPKPKRPMPSRFYQEADKSTLEWINRDASEIAKMWKESRFSENHTKSVSDLINEYRKYYETHFRIKKPVLDKAFDVISKRLTELFNKGYIFGGYVDGYKMVLFHKDWLDKDIVNRFRSRIDSNPAYLICIDTATIPHAQLGVSVTETSYDYDGKRGLGNTRKLMNQINNNTVQESYVQEAIDFGTDSNTTPDGGDDTPPAPTGDQAPSVDIATDTGAEAGSDTDVSTNSSTDAANGGETSSDAETATVNDVSSEIAEKVAQKTDEDVNGTDNSGGLDETPTFDDDMSGTDGDMGGSDMDTSMDADAQLDELNDMASDDSTDDGSALDDAESPEDLDFDNMTIDDLIKSGSEKLKGMTLQQIKDFLKDSPEEAVQEAFFITKKNVDIEVDAKIRDCLGILNDNKMNIDTLIKAFKGSAHKLNRVLTKAARLKKVYNADEIRDIKNLNKALVDLLTQLKKSKDNKNVDAVKRQILVFTTAAKKVAAIVEGRINSKPVQEAFLLSNINDKITKALIPVKGNMEELKKLYDEGNLTRGRIVKRYGSSDSAIEGTTYTWYSKNAVNLDQALKLLNKAMRKKNVENLELISKLAEKLDLISDYIETLIDDSIQNNEMIKRIGKLSGELLDLINEFIGDDADELKGATDENDITDDTTDDSTPEETTETTETETEEVADSTSDDDGASEGSDNVEAVDGGEDDFEDLEVDEEGDDE